MRCRTFQIAVWLRLVGLIWNKCQKISPQHQPINWEKIDDSWFEVGIEDPLTGRMAEVHLPDGDLSLRTSSFVRSDQPGTVLWGGYFFVANGKFAATPESVKRLAFDPSQKMAYYCKVQLVTQMKRRQDRSEFVDASR